MYLVYTLATDLPVVSPLLQSLVTSCGWGASSSLPSHLQLMTSADELAVDETKSQSETKTSQMTHGLTAKQAPLSDFGIRRLLDRRDGHVDDDVTNEQGGVERVKDRRPPSFEHADCDARDKDDLQDEPLDLSTRRAGVGARQTSPSSVRGRSEKSDSAATPGASEGRRTPATGAVDRPPSVDWSSTPPSDNSASPPSYQQHVEVERCFAIPPMSLLSSLFYQQLQQQQRQRQAWMDKTAADVDMLQKAAAVGSEMLDTQTNLLHRRHVVAAAASVDRLLSPSLKSYTTTAALGDSALDSSTSAVHKDARRHPQRQQHQQQQGHHHRYGCRFCGKMFPRSANLTRHLRTHTGHTLTI